MSEAPVDYNPNVEDEETEETPPGPEDDGEQSPDDKGDDAAKLKKALQRERNAKKKALSDLAELRKQAQQGDPNKGEMEKLSEQVEKLQQSIATKDRVTALLEAGFNQTAAKAERLLRVVDDFDGEDWIEELKADYPERFGKAGRPPAAGSRPFTGGGRDPGTAPTKDPNTRHVDAMLKAARRS